MEMREGTMKGELHCALLVAKLQSKETRLR